MGRATAQRTPFDGAFRAIAGAAFEAVDGWETARRTSAIRSPSTAPSARRCGVWDASPLRKWEVRGPGAALAVERFFTNEMGTLQRGQLRYGAFCDDDGMMLGDGIAFRFAEQEFGLVTRAGDRRRGVRRGRRRRRVRAEGRHRPTLRTCSCRAPTRARCWRRSRAATCAALRYYRFLPEPVLVGGVPGARSRAAATPASWATSCTPSRLTPGGCWTPSSAPGACGPTARGRWRRCGARPG